MVEWSQIDVTRFSKIQINPGQGSTNIKLGRVILEIWQGESKSWQGGPKLLLIDKARHIYFLTGFYQFKT